MYSFQIVMQGVGFQEPGCGQQHLRYGYGHADGCKKVPWVCTLHLIVLSGLQIASCSVTCAVASSEASAVQRKLIR